MVREMDVVRETALRNGRDPDEIVLGHVNFCHLVDGRRDQALKEQKEWFGRALGPAVTFERVRALHWTGTLDDIAEQVQARLDAGVEPRLHLLRDVIQRSSPVERPDAFEGHRRAERPPEPLFLLL